MRPSLIYQDNKSAMFLEKNGKASISKRTKHINVRYFFVKDKIANGEVVLEHGPTEVMWADINTKPKQGRAWIIFRSMLMGIPKDYDNAKEGITHAKAMTARAEAAEKQAQVKTMELAPTMTPDPSQECVGANPEKENMSPRVSKRQKKIQNKIPPIMIVRGWRWSPSIYCNVRLAGFGAYRAWVEAFVQ